MGENTKNQLELYKKLKANYKKSQNIISKDFYTLGKPHEEHFTIQYYNLLKYLYDLMNSNENHYLYLQHVEGKIEYGELSEYYKKDKNYISDKNFKNFKKLYLLLKKDFSNCLEENVEFIEGYGTILEIKIGNNIFIKFDSNYNLYEELLADETDAKKLIYK